MSDGWDPQAAAGAVSTVLLAVAALYQWVIKGKEARLTSQAAVQEDINATAIEARQLAIEVGDLRGEVRALRAQVEERERDIRRLRRERDEFARLALALDAHPEAAPQIAARVHELADDADSLAGLRPPTLEEITAPSDPGDEGGP
jgi:predicted RNase H-like nuclease (RuvC/YqgF family)